MICGVHAVYEALAAWRRPIERIHVSRDARIPRLKEILDLSKQRGVPVRREDRLVLDRMAPGLSHQGIVAVVGDASYSSMADLKDSGVPCVIVLDGVEDTHNLGAVIRSAEAAGASGVVVPERHSAPLSATVARASAGAVAHLPVVRVGNTVATLDDFKKRGMWVVGVDQEGDRLWTEFDYTTPVVLVFGGEHRGLRRLVREHCDALVRLPMLGKVTSLNVSVAAGVLLYEVVRQRMLRRAAKD